MSALRSKQQVSSQGKKGKQQSQTASQTKNSGKRHCHVCRSPKDISKIAYCSSGKRSHIFCSSCIERRLQVPFNTVLNDPSWICPKCLNCCPCSKCRKKEDPKSQEKITVTKSSNEDKDAALTLLTIKHSPRMSWTESGEDNQPDPSQNFELPSVPSTVLTSPPTRSSRSLQQQQQKQQQQQLQQQQQPQTQTSTQPVQTSQQTSHVQQQQQQQRSSLLLSPNPSPLLSSTSPSFQFSQLAIRSPNNPSSSSSSIQSEEIVPLNLPPPSKISSNEQHSLAETQQNQQNQQKLKEEGAI